MREERIDWPNGAKMALSVVVNVEEGGALQTSGLTRKHPIDAALQGLFWHGGSRLGRMEGKSCALWVRATADQLTKITLGGSLRLPTAAQAVPPREPTSPGQADGVVPMLDILRFGFTPLYIGFEDVWNAVEQLRQVLASGEWQEARFNQQHAVT